MIKAVAIDYDDVIRISNREQQRELSSSIGFVYEELMKTIWQHEAGLALLRGKIERDEWWNRIQEDNARLQDVDQSFIWDRLFGDSQIDSDLIEFISTFSDTLPTSIFTNCDKESKTMILQEIGDNHPFTHIISSSDIGFVKPDSTAFLRMLTLLDAAPNECLLIDDSSRNVIAARGLEIEAVVYSGLERFKEIIKIVLDSQYH
jgi:putative hydrolase of the HAD superfamily